MEASVRGTEEADPAAMVLQMGSASDAGDASDEPPQVEQLAQSSEATSSNAVPTLTTCCVVSEQGLRVGLDVPFILRTEGGILQFVAPDRRLLQAVIRDTPATGETLAVHIPGRLLDITVPAGATVGVLVRFRVPNPDTRSDGAEPQLNDSERILQHEVQPDGFELLARVPAEQANGSFPLLLPGACGDLETFLTSQRPLLSSSIWAAPQLDLSGFLRGKTFMGRRGAVNYVLYGHEGPLVVCIHGLLGALSTFELLAASLVSRFQVLVFDLYGYGLSASPPERFQAEMFADQVLELVAGLGFSQSFFLIGYSIGGVVASHLALHHAAQVRSLLLLAPAGLLPLGAQERLGISFLQACQLVRLPVTNIVSSFAPWFVTPANVNFEPDVQDPEQFANVTKLNAKRVMSDPSKYTKAWLKGVRDLDVSGNEAAWSGLNGLLPVALIWGDDDAVVSFESCRDALGRCLPTAPVVLLEGAGHGFLLENHREVVHHIIGWFCGGCSVGCPAAMLAQRTSTES